MIKTTVTIKEDRSKFDKLMRQLSGSGAYVSVGVHEDAGRYTEGANPPTVVEVALWNEFGTTSGGWNGKGIPERSFIRSAIDENLGKINTWRKKALAEVISGKKSQQQALSEIGFKVQVLIQNKIKSNVPPPNTDATAAAKKEKGVAPNTLIDTGLLLRSITFKVNEGGR